MLSLFILGSIIGQWLYPALSQLQFILLNIIHKALQRLATFFNTAKHLQPIGQKMQLWVWVALFWLLCSVIYFYSQDTFLALFIMAFLCAFAIYMPMPPLWVLYKKTDFTTKNKKINIYHKYLRIFATYGQHMLTLQNTEKINTIQTPDYETYAKAMLAMWCYHFFLPLLLLCLPHGGFIVFSWVVLRHTCLRIHNMYLIYVIEWLPRQFLLILSGLLGYFEKCIKQAKIEKQYQNSVHLIADKDIESWLWQGIKGAINLNHVDSRQNYDDFVRFLAKLVLAVILVFIFTRFI